VFLPEPMGSPLDAAAEDTGELPAKHRPTVHEIRIFLNMPK
jgi:hypothetical protein